MFPSNEKNFYNAGWISYLDVKAASKCIQNANGLSLLGKCAPGSGKADADALSSLELTNTIVLAFFKNPVLFTWI